MDMDAREGREVAEFEITSFGFGAAAAPSGGISNGSLTTEGLPCKSDRLAK